MTEVYRPEDLAQRWQCSARHVRNMIRDGRLPAFRLGGKLWRVRGEDVREFEQCGDLEDTGASGARSREREHSESVVRLARIEAQRSGSSTV